MERYTLQARNVVARCRYVHQQSSGPSVNRGVTYGMFAYAAMNAVVGGCYAIPRIATNRRYEKGSERQHCEESVAAQSGNDFSAYRGYERMLVLRVVCFTRIPLPLFIWAGTQACLLYHVRRQYRLQNMKILARRR